MHMLVASGCRQEQQKKEMQEHKDEMQDEMGGRRMGAGRDGIYPHESGHGRDAGFWYITRRSICADLRRL